MVEACREGRIIKDIALSHCVRAKEGEKSEQAKHDSKNIPAPNARFRASYGCVRSRVGEGKPRSGIASWEVSGIILNLLLREASEYA